MLEDIRPGLMGEMEWVVGDEHSVGHGDSRVFSTPSMVLLTEIAAAQAIQPLLAANQSSVGTRIDVRHLAATPVGMRVRAEARVLEVDRRRIRFHVDVFDEMEKVGEGEQERFVIDLDRYGERLDAKRKLVAEREASA